jgi:hypothetical protein
MGVSLRAAALAVVVGTGLAAGFVEKAADLRKAFRGAPKTTIPEDVRIGALEVAKAWPPGAGGAYVSDDTEWSACGIWQRALHPRAVMCCRTPDPGTVELFRTFRANGNVQWAFGKGTPPDQLGLEAVRRLPSGLWFADLRRSR